MRPVQCYWLSAEREQKSTNGSRGTMWDGYDTDYGRGRLSTWDTTNMDPYSDIWSSVQEHREGKTERKSQARIIQHIEWQGLLFYIFILRNTFDKIVIFKKTKRYTVKYENRSKNLNKLILPQKPICAVWTLKTFCISGAQITDDGASGGDPRTVVGTF